MGRKLFHIYKTLNGDFALQIALFWGQIFE